jgi:hypothetical protein
MKPLRVLLLVYNLVCIAVLGLIGWSSIPLLTG